jgi:hypothetical protein
MSAQRDACARGSAVLRPRQALDARRRGRTWRRPSPRTRASAHMLMARRRNSHGFIVFAPKLVPEPGQPLYLEFEIEGSWPGFPAAGGRDATQPRRDAGARLRPARSEILDRDGGRRSARSHLPCRPPRSRRRKVDRDASTSADFKADAALGLVIGLDHRQRELSSPLRAARDRSGSAGRCRSCVAVPGRKLRPDRRRGAPARQVLRPLRCASPSSTVSRTACDAMEAGARACRFQTIALLSGAAQIRMPGWLGRLERAYQGARRPMRGESDAAV